MRSSGFFVIIFNIFLVNFVKSDVLTDLQYIRACNATSPISLETMNQVLINKQLDEKHSKNFKCFLHCLFNKYGWMDEDGGFLLHEMKKMLEEVQLPQSTLEYILYKCTALNSMDKCERSFLFTECFWKKTEEKQDVDDQFLYNMMEDKK